MCLHCGLCMCKPISSQGQAPEWLLLLATVTLGWFPLGLGLAVEYEPSELWCRYVAISLSLT